MRMDVGRVRGQLGRLRDEYDDRLEAYLAGLDGTKKDRVLEAHTRGWLLDQVVTLFGWSPDSVIPEYPVESPPGSDKKRWFLDYLGLEIDNDGRSVPLLVIEAKRLRESGPRPSIGNGPQSVWSSPELLAKALKGHAKLTGKWSDWLATAGEYVVRLHRDRGRYPLKYVMTNGEWFVIFTDPKAAFVDKTATSESILVYESWAAFCGGLERSLPHMERYSLLKQSSVQEIELGHLAATLEFEGGLCRWVYAVDILYRRDAAVLGPDPIPDLKVWPGILFKCGSGVWFAVRADPVDGPLRLPSNSSDHDKHMSSHFDAVHALAEKTMRMAVESAGIGEWPEASTLEEHLSDADGLACVPLSVNRPHKSAGVTHLRVVTGDVAHFVQPADKRARACSFHSVNSCPDGRKGPHPFSRSLDSNTFFKSSEVEACLHRSSREVKGPQPSAQNSKARCHLWALETGLCCRVCTLEAVCFARKSFAAAMPCPAPPSEDQERRGEGGDTGTT